MRENQRRAQTSLVNLALFSCRLIAEQRKMIEEERDREKKKELWRWIFFYEQCRKEK